MGKPFLILENKFKNLNITDNNIVLEIGSHRRNPGVAGSSLFFHNWAKQYNIDFYSIDVIDDATYFYNYINFIVSNSGHEWCRDILPTLNKKIKMLYLDNFDWIWNPNEELPNYTIEQINLYLQRGVIMNNENSQEEHRLQALFCIPYMDNESVVIFDDTWKDQFSPTGYNGKCGTAIPLFINSGFIIDPDPQYGGLFAYRNN
jgi:hypothetical protein